MEDATDDQYEELLEHSRKGRKEEFLELIGKYRFPNDRIEQPDGILVQVVQNGDTVCLKELIKQGVDVTSYRATNGDQISGSPLFLNKVLRNPSCVQVLLENNIEVNALNKAGENALHVGILDKAPLDTIRLLLENGIDVNLKNDQSNTALNSGCHAVEYVKLLIEHKADVNIHNNLGQTPLMQSIRLPTPTGSDLDTPRLLLENGADVNAKDKHHRTPLHYASSYMNPDMVKLLLQHGANTDNVDESSQTPLMFSIFYTEDTSQYACHNILLSSGCNFNLVDVRGNSALHHAARCGRPNLVTELCERGANVNLKSERGFTPLINSIQEKKVNCMRILLKFGGELESLQKKVNLIHNSIMSHIQRQNNSKLIETIYKLILISGLQMDYQLPCDLECEETKKMASSPRLMHCSRRVIRRTAAQYNQHTNLFCSVPQLPLPQRLKEYLLYDVELMDLDKFDSNNFNSASVIKLS